jgi:TolB-like protein/DNA-binding winged helix-turn-helix (wHTH) protein
MADESVRDQALAERFSVAGWHVDTASGTLRRGAEEVRLPPRVMDVLVYLAARPNEVVTREQLEAAVWAGRVVGYDAVAGAVQKLRKAFADDPRQPRVIETLSKRGYRLLAKVEPDAESAHDPDVPAAAAAAAATKSRRMGPAVFLPVLLLVVAAAAAVFLWPASGPAPDTTSRTSVAVLAFTDLGGQPDQSYFAEGLAADLITDLAQISALHVIARDSSFFYRDEAATPVQIGRDLKVRYILHGSVRRAGGRVRINALLTDAASGAQVWAERYDEPVDDLFRLQDRITGRIVAALAVELTDNERKRLVRRASTSVEAYELLLRGEDRFFRYSRLGNLEARGLFEQAAAADPMFARVQAMLAWTHVFDFMNGWTTAPQRSLDMAEALSTHALELDPVLPLGYFVRGLVYRERGEYVKALVEAQHAIEYDPSYANGHVLLATLLYYAGRPQEGLERMQQAIALNPHHPYNYPFHLGQALFVLARYDEAIAAFREGLASNPASERLRIWLAAALARAGQVDEARWEIEQVRTVNPDVSLRRIRAAFPFSDAADLERFVDALQMAGLQQ